MSHKIGDDNPPSLRLIMPILFVATDIDGDVELIVCRPQPEHLSGFRIAFDRVWRIERFHLGRAKDLTRIRLKF